MRKLIVMIAFLSVAAVAKAQEFKIGYTFLEYIVGNMPEMEKITSELETYYSQLQAQIEAKQKDIETNCPHILFFPALDRYYPISNPLFVVMIQ